MVKLFSVVKKNLLERCNEQIFIFVRHGRPSGCPSVPNPQDKSVINETTIRVLWIQNSDFVCFLPFLCFLCFFENFLFLKTRHNGSTSFDFAQDKSFDSAQDKWFGYAYHKYQKIASLSPPEAPACPPVNLWRTGQSLAGRDLPLADIWIPPPSVVRLRLS